jgi:hypothetical protein
MYGQSSPRLLGRCDRLSRLSTPVNQKIFMGKLKKNRKSVCSPQTINKINTIVADNWDDIWKIVQQRAQTTQSINRQKLRKLQIALSDGLTGNNQHPELSIRDDCGKIGGESTAST